MSLNKLAEEKSPYLLQHAENPVSWHPWGDEAIEKARAEDKPIFLSIGYATCHWCHVMAHESFEDPETAEVLNRHYVSIKVDREERPDIDQVYMAACQALTGQGGWPLSAFLTPEGKPFYVGTYFPKTSRFGRPGFIDLLTQLSSKWHSERDIILRAAEQLTQALQGPAAPDPADHAPGMEALRHGLHQLTQSFDRQWGGFGAAPKFPTPHYLSFLLRWHRREGGKTTLDMVEKTLKAMRWGGIYDQVGLGFHRYSVDEKWLVPHFEKMLYDQALLALAFTEAFQVTGKPFYADVTREIFTYVLRDMTSEEGGFYSAQDADSEGEEGLFYVWRPQEIISELGEELGGLFCRYYGITDQGNFENGLSIPHITRSLEDFARAENSSAHEIGNRLEEARLRLFDLREKRIHPLTDDKILTSWNGLMIAALAKGAQALNDDNLARAASRAADFVMSVLETADGQLLRRYRQGETAHPGYLEDYAFLTWGLIELYETTFNLKYLEKALSLTRTMLDLYRDEETGGLFFTEKKSGLIARQKESYDGAIPSGNSVAALNLLRLGRMTGEPEFEKRADEILKAFARIVSNYPRAHTHFLMAVDFTVGPGKEIVIAEGQDREKAKEMIRKVHQSFQPHKALLFKPHGEEASKLTALSPFVADMEPVEGSTSLYLCNNFACQQPITEMEDLDEALK